jgi:hypothetical protein
MNFLHSRLRGKNLVSLFLLFCSLLFSPVIHAGHLSDLVTNRAAMKNVKQFTAFADSIDKRIIVCIDRTIQWSCHQDNSQFTGSYWQIAFRFAERGIGRKDEYTDVYMFIRGDSLLYCEVVDLQQPAPTGTFFLFTDSLKMKTLSDAWKNIYGTGLKMTDFDSLDYTYGFRCSDGGTKPDGRMLLDEMVRTRDTVLLNQWLQSPLPGRQAYAVDGFYQLSKRGIWLSAQQKQRIAAVQSRDAALTFCNGDTYDIKRLKDVLKSFVF